MSWTKQQIIESAIEEIGIASFEFDIQTEEKTSALKRLDAMMAEWNSKGVRLGYPLYADQANSSLSEASGIPDSAVRAVILNLAIDIAPSYGRQVSRETKVGAKKGFDTLLFRSGVMDPIEKSFPDTLPRGAGNKSRNTFGDTYFPTPSDPVDAGPDSVLEF